MKGVDTTRRVSVHRENVRPIVVLLVLVSAYQFLPAVLPGQQFAPSGQESARMGSIRSIPANWRWTSTSASTTSDR